MLKRAGIGGIIFEGLCSYPVCLFVTEDGVCPMATILLAWFILKERLQWCQRSGVLIVIIAICIADWVKYAGTLKQQNLLGEPPIYTLF